MMRFSALLVACALLLAAQLVAGQTATVTPPTIVATTQANRDGFIGTYTPVAGCVSSATCCCATSPVVITAVPATTNQLALAGTTDGGAGCLGQTALAGDFTMYQPLAAFSYISVIPVLFEIQTESTYTWLQLNTTKTTCNIVFQRNAVVTPPSTTNTTNTTTPPSTVASSSTGVSDPLSSLFPGLNLTGLPTLGSNPFASNPLNLTSLPPNPFSTNSGGLTAIPGLTGSGLPPNPFGGSGLPTPPGPPGSVNTQSTSSSSTGSAGSSNGGVTFTPQLVQATNMNATAGSKNYLAAFTTPASSGVKFVILHYTTTADMRQQNVYMNLTSSSSLATQLLAAQPSGSVTPLASYFVFVQGPINLEDTDAITYGFTYSTKDDGSNAFNTPSYTYSKATATAANTAASVTVPADAVASLPGFPIVDTVPPADTTNINTNSAWNGQFQADASCVPSDTCCCGVGVMNVSTTTADPTHVLISGNLDGGAGCLYQTSLSGLMVINSTDAQSASRSVTIPNANSTVVVFNAKLSTPAATSGMATAAANSQLTLWNSFRPCQTVALKVAAYNPGGNTTTTPPVDPNAARDAFLGEYDFDTSCVPSASCCCAQGPLAITAVNSSTIIPPMPPALAALVPASNTTASTDYSQEILFTASLDGGSACVGMSNVAQVFDISATSPTTATFAVPPVLSLSALLSASSPTSALDTVTFKNSIYPTCLSVAKKRAVSVPVTSSTGSSGPSDPPTTTLTAAQMLAVRNSYLGDYDSSGCVVSSTCCCTSGVTSITANSTSTSLVDVSTTLVGSGFSCLQQDGAQHMVFTITNATAATATPFSASTVQFYATMNSNNQIVVSNTVHPACPTVLIKRAPIEAAATPNSISHASLLAALVAVAVALVFVAQ